jgi:hypothetical protein
MSESKYEQCLPSLLKTTQEGHIFMQGWATNTSLRASHSYPHSFCSTQPKDTPLRFLVFTQTLVLQHGFKAMQQKSPFQMHICPFTCPFFYSLDFLSFIINP